MPSDCEVAVGVQGLPCIAGEVHEPLDSVALWTHQIGKVSSNFNDAHIQFFAKPRHILLEELYNLAVCLLTVRNLDPVSRTRCNIDHILEGRMFKCSKWLIEAN